MFRDCKRLPAGSDVCVRFDSKRHTRRLGCFMLVSQAVGARQPMRAYNTFFVDVSGSSLPLGLDTPSYTLMAGMALLLVRALTNSLSFCNMENGFHKHKRRALIK